MEFVNPTSLSFTLAGLLRKAIQTRFESVDKLLKWFGDIAENGTKSGHQIHWTCPTGFVVWQDYRARESTRVSVLGRKYRYYKKLEKQDPKKHKAGLGPNFIHSCDAAHLMRTVNTAYQKGIRSFRMIHDSYATHAADMETLTSILRDEFVKMYQGQNLLDELVQNIALGQENITIAAPPSDGKLDIEQVRNSEYFFA